MPKDVKDHQTTADFNYTHLSQKTRNTKGAQKPVIHGPINLLALNRAKDHYICPNHTAGTGSSGSGTANKIRKYEQACNDDNELKAERKKSLQARHFCCVGSVYPKGLRGHVFTVRCH